jgi:hypothetical protein
MSRVVQTRLRVGGVATTGVAKKGETLFAAHSRMSSVTYMNVHKRHSAGGSERYDSIFDRVSEMIEIDF